MLYVPGKYLQCDRAVEPCIARLVDLAHSAGAEWGENFIRAEARPGCQGQGPDYRAAAPLDLIPLLAIPRIWGWRSR